VRRFAQVARTLEPFGVVRVHRNHAVNVSRVTLIRRRKDSDDWEVKLQSPVHTVLPVARGRLGSLCKAFGG
jgi:DNA-binding LytR/AlgR family response regulator